MQVFFYVPSATVDLSIFGSNRDLVIESLRSAHRSLRFRPVPQERKVFIEGPFAAVQALRRDLIRRADELQSAVTVQTAGINPRESGHNTRLISHHKYVDSVSHSSSKREPASSLSTEPRAKVRQVKSKDCSQRLKTPPWGKKFGSREDFESTHRWKGQTGSSANRTKKGQPHTSGREGNQSIFLIGPSSTSISQYQQQSLIMTVPHKNIPEQARFQPQRLEERVIWGLTRAAWAVWRIQAAQQSEVSSRLKLKMSQKPWRDILKVPQWRVESLRKVRMISGLTLTYSDTSKHFTRRSWADALRALTYLSGML